LFRSGALPPDPFGLLTNACVLPHPPPPCYQTSLIQRATTNTFDRNYKATIGVDFCLREIEWNPTTRVFLQLWDIAGQERFANLTRMYYREARGAFVVFDLSRPKTLHGCLKWKRDIDGKVTLPNGDDVPCVLLANKSDIAAPEPVDLEEFAQENGFTAVYRTSAKLGEGIEDAVSELVRQIIASDDMMAARQAQAPERGGLNVVGRTGNAEKPEDTCCIRL
jgi:Ras-related protein Rab-32